MISADEYEKMIDNLLTLEIELQKLGNTTINTSQGVYYLSERIISDNHPEQEKYNKLHQQVVALRAVVDAYDKVARYKLASISS